MDLGGAVFLMLLAGAQPQTSDEKRRHAAAQVRKQLRRELEERFTQTRQAPGV